MGVDPNEYDIDELRAIAGVEDGSTESEEDDGEESDGTTVETETGSEPAGDAERDVSQQPASASEPGPSTTEGDSYRGGDVVEDDGSRSDTGIDDVTARNPQGVGEAATDDRETVARTDETATEDATTEAAGTETEGIASPEEAKDPSIESSFPSDEWVTIPETESESRSRGVSSGGEVDEGGSGSSEERTAAGSTGSSVRGSTNWAVTRATDGEAVASAVPRWGTHDSGQTTSLGDDGQGGEVAPSGGAADPPTPGDRVGIHEYLVEGSTDEGPDVAESEHSVTFDDDDDGRESEWEDDDYQRLSEKVAEILYTDETDENDDE